MEISIEQAKIPSKSDVPVLLRGEVRIGKRIVCAMQSIVAVTGKFNKFVRVNCANRSCSLLNEELFGEDDQIRK